MLGEKIRQKRNEKGMSMKELADQTGLSPGFISQVERDLAEPSITSLRKISEALEVALFHFFVDEEREDRVVRKNNRQKIRFPESKVVYELMSPDLNRQMETFMGTLKAGAMTSIEPMAHMGEEVIHVIEGEMFIQIGNETYTLYEGDTIYYYGTIPHLIKNTTDSIMRFISTITPPRF